MRAYRSNGGGEGGAGSEGESGGHRGGDVPMERLEKKVDQLTEVVMGLLEMQMDERRGNGRGMGWRGSMGRVQTMRAVARDDGV